MVKLQVSERESSAIAAELATFLREPPETLSWLVGDARRFQLLPLYVGWTVAIGIRPDGAVLQWSHEGDYEGTRDETDPLSIRLAIVEGAKAHDCLRSLIPLRPAKAKDCPHCAGRGSLPAYPNIICSCGGLGWIDDESSHSGAQFRASMDSIVTVKARLPLGCIVRVVSVPSDVDGLPPDSQAAFRAAVGRDFEVKGHGPYGHLELEFGPELDEIVGGFMNTIWIEPELVQRIDEEP